MTRVDRRAHNMRSRLTERNIMVQVGIVMGSHSDWEIMQFAAETLKDFGIDYEAKIVSAHRTPDLLFEYASLAEARGIKVIIAGAGGAAHLPGMIASKTIVPVFGVPVPSKYLKGQDSLLSIVQMPKGIPVGTLAIGEAGSTNAALLAIAVLARFDEKLAAKLHKFRQEQTQKVVETSIMA
jgi:5-(carboxyamino)imidazole ribonucleotide mutase